jgi:hypothetical protein
MGKAPKILEELRQTREQVRESERQWFLDTTSGELKPEEVPTEDPQTRPQPVRVARQTFD